MDVTSTPLLIAALFFVALFLLIIGVELLYGNYRRRRLLQEKIRDAADEEMFMRRDRGQTAAGGFLSLLGAVGQRLPELGVGRVVPLEHGQWRAEPDYPGAVAIYRRLLKELFSATAVAAIRGCRSSPGRRPASGFAGQRRRMKERIRNPD